jgi:hypothetical protein
METVVKLAQTLELSVAYWQHLDITCPSMTSQMIVPNPTFHIEQ